MADETDTAPQLKNIIGLPPYPGKKDGHATGGFVPSEMPSATNLDARHYPVPPQPVAAPAQTLREEDAKRAIAMQAEIGRDFQERLQRALGALEQSQRDAETLHKHYGEQLEAERKRTREANSRAEYWRNEHTKLVSGINHAANALLSTTREATSAGIETDKGESYHS